MNAFRFHARKFKSRLPFAVALTIAAVTAVNSGAAAFAAEKPNSLLDIDWKRLKAQGQLKGGEIVADEGPRKNPLKVESSGAAGGMPRVVPLLDIKLPPIKKPVYRLSGWVRYKDVEGPAYFEMWSLFPDGSHYFSRTLAGAGPMQWLAGSSDWRAVEIPFQMEAGPKAARPNHLVLNVVFPGKGTVWVSNLALTESDTLIVPDKSGSSGPGTGAWWSDRVGPLFLELVVLLLILDGVAMGVLAARGVAREVVFAGTAIGIALGSLLAGVGIVAAVMQQPAVVVAPLFLSGAICAAACAGGLFVFRNWYVQRELRRMEAMDVDR